MTKFPWSVDEKLPPKRKPRKIGGFVFKHFTSFAFGLLFIFFVATFILPSMLATVPSGDVGVLWKRFNGPGIQCWCLLGRGTVLDPSELRQEGMHLIWPWDKIFNYDLRLQSIEETYFAISKDGVGLKATINIRFQLQNNSAGVLHKYVGPDYAKTVVLPEIGSRARQVISERTAEEVYTGRVKVEEDIRSAARITLGENLDRLIQPAASEQFSPNQYDRMLRNSVALFDTLMLNIELPETIVTAINRKTDQYYQAQEYQFRIDKEAKETQRKQIEADGIAAFQKTVSAGISDSYLRWRGIEATLQLAQSTNSKIIIIGSGKEGLPIILGNMDGNGSTPTEKAPPPVDPEGNSKPNSSGQSLLRKEGDVAALSKSANSEPRSNQKEISRIWDTARSMAAGGMSGALEVFAEKRNKWKGGSE